MNTEFIINSTSYADILSDLNIEVAHTYAGDIERTLSGKVSSFPTSFRTIGLNVVIIGKIPRLTTILNTVQVPKVTISFNDTVYVCNSGIFSCTDAKIDRLKDKNDVFGQLSMAFVSVGIPTLTPNETAGTVTIVAPNNE